jgi:protein-disulfide isomerase
MKWGDNNIIGWTNTWAKVWENNASAKGLEITVIGDKRCTNCATTEILSQLKQVPFLTGATFIEKDFSDNGVSDYIKENKIKTLPVFVFSNNNINDDGSMKKFLIELPNKAYFLQIWATFDPFAKRTEKGFLVIDTKIVETIKGDSYLQWSKDTDITWIEYSDLECPFCAKFHNSGTIEEVMTKYGNKINRIFNHFPLEFHKNAQAGAEILECVGELSWSDTFYALAKESYSKENSTQTFLIDEAVKLKVDKTKLTTCLESHKYAEKVKNQMMRGSQSFWINWTPGNILINNKTGEYEVLSGALPTQTFTDVIDKLLK